MGDLVLPDEKYEGLCMLTGFDTSHDFFQKKGPITNSIGDLGGGASGRERGNTKARGRERGTTKAHSTNADHEGRRTKKKNMSYDKRNEELEIAWLRSGTQRPGFEGQDPNKIWDQTIQSLGKEEEDRNWDPTIDILDQLSVRIDEDLGFDSIFDEDLLDMSDDYLREYLESIGADPAGAEAWWQQVEGFEKQLGVGDSGEMDEEGLGGGMLSAARSARPMRGVQVARVAALNRELISKKHELGQIIRRIRVWDANILGLNVVVGDTRRQTIYKFNDLIKNAVVGTNTDIQKAGFYTLYEYFRLESPKSEIITSAFSTTQNTISDLRHAPTFFSKEIIRVIGGKNSNNDFKGFMGDILKFVKYTTVPEFSDPPKGLILINPTTTIDITSFVQKKWRSLDPINYPFINNNAEWVALLSDIQKGEKLTLTPEQNNHVDKLHSQIMNWWVDNIYGPPPTAPNPPNFPITNRVPGQAPPSGWETKTYAIIKSGGEKLPITDQKLVSAFQEDELGISLRGGKPVPGIWREIRALMPRDPATKLWPESNPGVSGDPIAIKMREVAREASSRCGFGNNEAAVQNYTVYPATTPPKSVPGPVLDTRVQHNCNWHNTVDPGPRCQNADCPYPLPSSPDIIVIRNSSGSLRMTFTIDPNGSPKTLSNGTCEYSIMLPRGTELTNRTGTNKSEGLSKTNVLKKVMDYIKLEMGLVVPVSNNGEALRWLIDEVLLPMPPKHAHPDLDRILKTVISIFILKTFGDYGQELLSVRQSMTTPTVFIGNDWISCIRYLYLMKYVVNAGSNDWWGGFMGVSGAFLFANLVGFQGGGRRKGKSKRVRKRTKKGKKKSKRTKKRSKKKSKRTTKGKKKSKRK